MASAFYVNRVTLLGNLGQDPEMRTTQSGKAVCSIRIATTESYKDQTGNWVDTTDWHSVTLWDRLAERVGQYARKGTKVYVEGKLKHRSYERDGVTRYITEVLADQIIILDRTQGGGGQQGGYQQNQGGYPPPPPQSQYQNQGGGYNQPNQGGYNAPQPQQPQQQQYQAPAAPPAPEDNFNDDFDDDVPF
jgi:single-strand DNA-binding protein